MAVRGDWHGFGTNDNVNVDVDVDVDVNVDDNYLKTIYNYGKRNDWGNVG